MRVNPTNAVPVYTDLQDQLRFQPGCSHFATGLLHPMNSIPSFQFYIDNVVTGNPFLQLYDAITDQPVSLGLDGYIDIYASSDRTYLIHNSQDLRSLVFSTVELCGLFYAKIDFNSTEYYTEVFWLKNFTSYSNIYRITFQDNNDTLDTIYQYGYKDRLYFEAFEADPQIQETEDVSINARQVEVLNFHNIKHRPVLELKDFPNYLIGSFRQLKSRDQVDVKDMDTMTEELLLSEIEFDIRPQFAGWNIGTLSWTRGNYFKAGTQENLTLKPV